MVISVAACIHFGYHRELGVNLLYKYLIVTIGKIN